MHNNAQIVLKTVGIFAQYSAQPNKQTCSTYVLKTMLNITQIVLKIVDVFTQHSTHFTQQ